MAVDIMQLLFEASRIQDLAYKYTNTVDQFLYLIFFPSLIVIAVVYLFMGKVVGDSKLKFLFTIAMFIFIIVYPPNSDKGLYTAIAPLGQIWFLGVAIVAVLWFFIGRHVGLGGGLPGLKSGGALSSIISRKTILRDLDDQIKIMRGTLNTMRSASPDKLADYIREFRAAYSIATDLEDKLKFKGFDIHGREKEVGNLLDQFERLENSLTRGGSRKAA